jgi:hypothetical protein
MVHEILRRRFGIIISPSMPIMDRKTQACSVLFLRYFSAVLVRNGPRIYYSLQTRRHIIIHHECPVQLAFSRIRKRTYLEFSRIRCTVLHRGRKTLDSYAPLHDFLSIIFLHHPSLGRRSLMLISQDTVTSVLVSWQRIKK